MWSPGQLLFWGSTGYFLLTWSSSGPGCPRQGCWAASAAACWRSCPALAAPPRSAEQQYKVIVDTKYFLMIPISIVRMVTDYRLANSQCNEHLVLFGHIDIFKQTQSNIQPRKLELLSIERDI